MKNIISTSNHDIEFCKCGHSNDYYTVQDDFGYWDVCIDCGKKIEYHYYNHYDAEDHDDADFIS